MMPLMRQEIEILLDTPHPRSFVVSAYADMTVQDGFNRYVDQHLRNQAREASEVLAETDIPKDLDAHIEVIRQAIAAADPAAKGLAIFVSVARDLRHVVTLDFPVENRLVIDEEPYVLPVLERWYGEPAYLIALIDTDEAHLFEAHHGRPESVRDLERPDVHVDIQRDKPRFTYKKRFAKAPHEYLHGMDEDPFLHEVAEALDEHWHAHGDGRFAGLILLGQSPTTAAVRKLLPRDLESAVVGEAPHAMTTQPDELSDDVTRIIDQARIEREERLMAELRERWKEKHLVANGPGEVLDALQQGRATQIVFGRRHEMPGARCQDCGYRFGAPVATCVYCNGRCQTVSAAQDILRLAMKQRLPVHLFRPGPKDDPLAPAGGVAALLRAEANWAPDGATVQAARAGGTA
jgi:peptide subunit release factor 1 (eRF1)